MSLRRAVALIDTDEVNVSAFCREHGISRDSFYTIRARYASEGEAGLELGSRAPKHVANRTSIEIEDEIVRLRKELEDRGLDAGAYTIRWHLDQQGVDPLSPSVATIWRILKKRGFIQSDPSKSPRKTWKRFVAERANELWQNDPTHFTLATGVDVDIANIIDDHSRVCVASRAIEGSATGKDVWDTFVVGTNAWGVPQRVLSDNGSPFTSGLFTTNVAALGVATTRSSPYHPQTNGKVERFHQTLKKWLDKQIQPDTVDELQTLLDEFVEIYNTQRPHRGIGRQTPKQAFDKAQKAAPDNTSILDVTTVHHNTVDRSGRVEIPGPYAITVGNAHTGQTATTIRTGNHAHIFVNNTLVRELTINPNQRSQPLYTRPGRPTP